MALISEDCESCGTPLPAPDADGLITCPSCGRVTRDDAPKAGSAGWPAPPVMAPGPGGDVPPSTWLPDGADIRAITISTDVADTAVKVAKVGRGCSIVVSLIVVAAIAGGIALAVHSGTDAVKKVKDAFDGLTSSNAIVLSGSAAPIASTPDPSDFVVVVQDYNDGESKRYLSRVKVDGGGFDEVWRSPAIASDAYNPKVAVVGDTLFAGLKDELWALSLSTGKQQWTTSLRDDVTNCDACFVAAEGRLVVRTQDAYLSGFNASSPEQGWTRRLIAQSAQVSSVGGHVYLADESGERGQSTRVHTIDPATGRDRRSIAPTCAPGPDEFSASTMSAGDPVYGVPGTKDLVAAFGFSNSCVVRWEATTGRVRFAARVRELSSIAEDQTLVGPQDIVISGTSDAMVRVSLVNGAQTRMAPGVDQQAVPSKIVGRKLLATTTTTRGTTKGGLAAFSLDTGRRIWNIPAPKGAQPVSRNHSSDALFDSSPRMVVTADDTTARLIVFQGEGRKLTIQPITLATGAEGNPINTSFPTRYDSGTPSLTVEQVGPTRLLATLDSLLISLPYDGQDIKRFPG